MEVKPTKTTYKHYLFFWTGQLCSLFGSTIVNFVLLWWLTIKTGSPGIISLAYFLNFTPLIALSPLAGVLADRFSRKKIIIIADSTEAFLSFLLVLSFWFTSGDITFVIIINTFRGVCQAFHQPTETAVLPSMVPKDKLSRINGVNFLFTGFVQTFGQVSAGILWSIFQEVNLSFMLMIDVITFFIALVPLLMIHIPSVVNQHLEKKPSFIEDFKEGFNILKSIPGLLILIGLAMLLNFLLRPITTLMTYFIHNVHGGSSLEYGFISACIQGGMILGAIATSVKKEWNNKMRWIFIGILSSMVAYGAFALAPHGYFIWLAISGAAFMFFIPIINSLYMTIIQITVPNDKIGRVSSIDTALSSLISPIGVILSGPLGELFGVGNLFLYCALIGFSVTLVTYIFSGVKHVNYDTLKDHLKSEESEPEILV